MPPVRLCSEPRDWWVWNTRVEASPHQSRRRAGGLLAQWRNRRSYALLMKLVRGSDPWFLLFVVLAILVAIALSAVVPILNVLLRPEYRASYGIVDPAYGVSRCWLVDVRFGSRTWILSTDPPRRLGVIELPFSDASNELLISLPEDDTLLAYQEFGWPIPSMCWSTGIADAVTEGELPPVRVGGGTHGTGPMFSISTPTGNHRWLLHATYLPGFISWWRVCSNVVTITGTLMLGRWAVRSLLLRFREKALGNRCPSCGHSLVKGSRDEGCSECGWQRSS